MIVRPRRRLLHTSDIHLGAHDDSPAHGLELENTFRRVIDIALREKVDVLLIAGDFFDNARIPTETLEFAAAEIARLGLPVVISPGNHDHVGKGSIYDRYDAVANTPNLRVIRDPQGETVALDALDIEIWGRPHTDDPSLLHFASPPPRGEAAWQIAAGHGHFIHPQASMQHSFHILEEDLRATQRDYVALGHWHWMTRVSAGKHVTAAYSGAPEADGSAIGGYVIVVDLLEDGEVRLVAHRTDGEAPLGQDGIPLLAGTAR